MKILLTAFIFSIPLFSYAETRHADGYNYDPAVGWFWYNLPEEKKDLPAERKQSQTPLSATQLMKSLHDKREELLNTAVINPTTENIRRYKQLQDWLVNRASLFSANWERVLLENPELDYNLQHSIYNGAAPVEYAKTRQLQAKAINYINQRYGVFFFYRGHEPLDNRLGNVVKEFSEQYGVPFIAISVDGRLNPDLPESRVDAGQAARMKISHFPAIMLVEPSKKSFKPLSYGFITQDDLARRVLNVVTNFAPRD